MRLQVCETNQSLDYINVGHIQQKIHFKIRNILSVKLNSQFIIESILDGLHVRIACALCTHSLCCYSLRLKIKYMKIATEQGKLYSKILRTLKKNARFRDVKVANLQSFIDLIVFNAVGVHFILLISVETMKREGFICMRGCIVMYVEWF